MTVYQEMRNERKRQDEKWGKQNHVLDRWLVILQEEVGEAAKAVLEAETANYRKELIQIAAVAIAAAESFDRNFKDDFIWCNNEKVKETP